MTVQELRSQLADLPPDSPVHIEVMSYNGCATAITGIQVHDVDGICVISDVPDDYRI